MNDSAGESSVRRSLLYVLLVLVIVLIAAVLLSSFTPLVRQPMVEVTAAGTVAAAITSATVSPTTEAVAQITPTIALATPWGVLGLDAGDPSPTPGLVAPAEDLPPVVLLGPPSGSQFGPNDSLMFYWDWPGELTDGLRLALYLQSADATVLVGTAEAGNLGTVQQVRAQLGEIMAEPGEYQWQVVVEEIATGTAVARSENRPIVLIADGSR